MLWDKGIPLYCYDPRSRYANVSLTEYLQSVPPEQYVAYFCKWADSKLPWHQIHNDWVNKVEMYALLLKGDL